MGLSSTVSLVQRFSTLRGQIYTTKLMRMVLYNGGALSPGIKKMVLVLVGCPVNAPWDRCPRFLVNKLFKTSLPSPYISHQYSI